MFLKDTHWLTKDEEKFLLIEKVYD